MQSLTYRELPDRRFGVELEVSNNLSKEKLGDIMLEFEARQRSHKPVKVTSGEEGWAQTSRNDYWHVKFDRSCGWEVASFIGSGPKDVFHIAKAARNLANHGAIVDDKCGLHVHAEVKDFTKQQMGVLLARWLKIEWALIRVCDTSRTNNPHCKSLWHRWSAKSDYDPNAPDIFWEIMKPQNYAIHENPEKRFTLNTIGFGVAQHVKSYNKNTLELRLPECLLEESHVRNWIRLFLNFVEVSSYSTAPSTLMPVDSLDDLLYYLGLRLQDNFLLMDKEIVDLKVWFLKKIIRKKDHGAFDSLKNQARRHLAFIIEK